MASGIPTLSVWTDLQAAGGTLVGYLRSTTSAETTIRENGDDRAAFRVALSDSIAADITEGRVIRAAYDDAEVEEWIVQRTTDSFPDDTLSVECSGARNWLGERVLTIDETTATGAPTLTFTGTATAILTSFTTDLPEWPSWVTVGTIDPTDSVTITLTSQNGLQAVLALLDAVNLARPVEDDAAVMRFRRVSNTEWTIDFLTTIAAGAYLETGKNVGGYSATRDRTQQASALAPVGADGVMAGEALFRCRYYTGPSGGQYEVGVEGIDGRATVVLGDDQWNGYYLVDSAGVAHEILDTVLDTPVSKVYVPDSAVPVAPGTGRLARNSAGDPLLTFRAPGAPVAGKVAFLSDTRYGRKINWTFIPSLDQYDSGILRGWTETVTAGTGTFSVDSTNFETGDSARKFGGTLGNTVQTATLLGGTGGQFDGQYRAGTWVVGVRAYRESATSANSSLQIGPINANGVAQTLSGTSTLTWSGTTGGWQTAEVEFTMTGTTDTTLTVQLTMQLGAAAATGLRFITVDRMWVFRKDIDDGDDTLVGSQMMDLVNAAQRQLRTWDGAAPVTHNVTAIDRYRDDPTGFPDDELAPYTTARLVIPERSLDTSVRIVEVRRDLFQPLRTTIQLGALRRRLTSQV